MKGVPLVMNKSHAHERGTLFVKNGPTGVALPYSTLLITPFPRVELLLLLLLLLLMYKGTQLAKMFSEEPCD